MSERNAEFVRRARNAPPDRARLAPLMVATMASQALLVVLAPTLVTIGDDLGASIGAVGQARSVTAGVAIVASIAIAGRIDTMGVPRLIGVGAALAIVASGAVAVSPTLAAFLAAHVLAGLALACLLSAGFAGVAAFSPDRRAWAIGYVAGANALAWIVVNPFVSIVNAEFSWRAAQIIPALIALAALVMSRAAVSPQRAVAVQRVRMLFAERSARRWIGAELLAYGAWTSLLTFIGAYFVDSLGVGEATVGWLLASGAATYFVASSRSGMLAGMFPRRVLVAASALLMGALLVVQLGVSGSAALATAIFCLVGFAAGVRTPASSGLGLEQLPNQPGAMMAARTAATQLGYLLGAVIGGAVIAAAGFAALGVVLAAGMAGSAALILRVDDPQDGRSDAG